jgi:ABC-type polysaccharide/polyol phosphate transport system, ATPase component
MNSEISIQVENISKRYRIGSVARLNFSKAKAREEREYWALRDVSFEIKRGESVALIGKNGAGKSTALKILSRITTPTSGRAVINGCMGTMLEVGTGFHPELTGRENIFLNGAILGMSKSEITRKFDDIVDFSGIGKFLDTPVKRYSSGMYVRLAFAVASNLEPDVLIVDEVLAVGDAAFQQKCIERMKSIARSGNTAILFVSHSMGNVKMLCERAIWFDQGTIRQDGATEGVAQDYMREQGMLRDVVPLAEREDRSGDGRWRAVDAQMAYAPERGCWVFSLQYESRHAAIDRSAVVVVVRKAGVIGDSVLVLDSRCAAELPEQIAGQGVLEVELSKDIAFAKGEYSCDVFCFYETGGAGNYAYADEVLNAMKFTVEPEIVLNWRRNPLTQAMLHARQKWIARTGRI